MGKGMIGIGRYGWTKITTQQWINDVSRAAGRRLDAMRMNSPLRQLMEITRRATEQLDMPHAVRCSPAKLARMIIPEAELEPGTRDLFDDLKRVIDVVEKEAEGALTRAQELAGLLSAGERGVLGTFQKWVDPLGATLERINRMTFDSGSGPESERLALREKIEGLDRELEAAMDSLDEYQEIQSFLDVVINFREAAKGLRSAVVDLEDWFEAPPAPTATERVDKEAI